MMLNVFENFLALSFQTSHDMHLREQLKFLDNHKVQLYFYRMGIETDLFSPETSSALLELMKIQIDAQTNINPYAQYALWGRSIFVYNLAKKMATSFFLLQLKFISIH